MKVSEDDAVMAILLYEESITARVGMFIHKACLGINSSSNTISVLLNVLATFFKVQGL